MLSFFFLSMNVMIYAYKRCTVFFFFGKEWERKECLKGTWYRLFKLRTENRKLHLEWNVSPIEKAQSSKESVIPSVRWRTNAMKNWIVYQLSFYWKGGLILGFISWNNQHHPVDLINHPTTKKLEINRVYHLMLLASCCVFSCLEIFGNF